MSNTISDYQITYFYNELTAAKPSQTIYALLNNDGTIIYNDISQPIGSAYLDISLGIVYINIVVNNLLFNFNYNNNLSSISNASLKTPTTLTLNSTSAQITVPNDSNKYVIQPNNSLVAYADETTFYGYFQGFVKVN